MKIFLLHLLGMMMMVHPMISKAQFALEPISLDQRIDHSDLIIEGEVVKRTAFINSKDQHIYTANQIKIYKIFKGFSSVEQVILLSPGGVVGNIGESVCPSINLNVGTIGTFFLYKSDITNESFVDSYQPFSGPQGCIHYDMTSNKAADVFNEFISFEDVYQKILRNTGKNYTNVNPLKIKPVSADKAAKPVILSVDPINVAAGIGDEIEIRGESFGNTKGIGKVAFLNASTGDPFVEPVSSQYLLWSDTLIRVIVPSGAGSGSVRVEQDGVSIFIGLKIRFAQLNFGNSNPNPVLMIDDNDEGGFTWEMSNGFYGNTDAKNSLERAMKSWSDNTCINWENGSPTVIDRDYKDGTNNIRFGVSGELPNGVLAHTRNYYSDCGTSTAYTTEIDLTFDPDRNWNYDAGSPGLNQYDIETIGVHELGHAHQLGHVRDNVDFMSPTVGTGVMKRDLGTNNIEAGLFVMKHSAAVKECGPESMTAQAGCQLPMEVGEIVLPGAVSIYPNPFKESLIFQFESDHFETIRVVDAQGRTVYENNDIDGISNHQWSVPQNLPNGMYIALLQNEFEISSKKVILSR